MLCSNIFHIEVVVQVNVFHVEVVVNGNFQSKVLLRKRNLMLWELPPDPGASKPAKDLRSSRYALPSTVTSFFQIRSLQPEFTAVGAWFWTRLASDRSGHRTSEQQPFPSQRGTSPECE